MTGGDQSFTDIVEPLGRFVRWEGGGGVEIDHFQVEQIAYGVEVFDPVQPSQNDSSTIFTSIFTSLIENLVRKETTSRVSLWAAFRFSGGISAKLSDQEFPERLRLGKVFGFLPKGGQSDDPPCFSEPWHLMQ